MRSPFVLSIALVPVFALACTKSARVAPPPEATAASEPTVTAPTAPPVVAAPVDLAATDRAVDEPRPSAPVPVAASAAPPPSPPHAYAPPSSPLAPRDDLDVVSRGMAVGAGGGAASGGLGRATGALALGAPSKVAGDAFGSGMGGSIAAGEWDDNANYRDFSKWLAAAPERWVPRVDVSHRRFLVVRDNAGRAIPGCRVRISDEKTRDLTITLTTGPSGRALFFPRAEGFEGDRVSATAECDGASVSRDVSLEAPDDVVYFAMPVDRRLPELRTIDVAFILDTTGSMSEEIASVKATIAKVASGLGQSNVAVRIGLVEYKDRGDAFVTRVHSFSSDVKSFAASVADLAASGGGDTPESVNEGVHVALSDLDWKASSIGRFAFLIGDAPPHFDYQQDFSYVTEMQRAAHRGIQVFTIAASGMDEPGQIVWRQIAEYTNAANLFVLRGGAGPQSTGGGDPKSSCGGTHASYTSGNLDGLILGEIRGELRAVDGDPTRIAGLREDEKAKPCEERVGMK